MRLTGRGGLAEDEKSAACEEDYREAEGDGMNRKTAGLITFRRWKIRAE